MPVKVSLKSYERDSTKMIKESKILEKIFFFSELDNLYFTE